jgi:hypothetical protein
MNAIRMDIHGLVQELLAREKEKRQHFSAMERNNGSFLVGAHQGSRTIRVAYDPPVGEGELGTYRVGMGMDQCRLLRSVREEDAQGFLEELLTEEVLRVIDNVIGDQGEIEVLYELPDEILSQRRVLRILRFAAELLARGLAQGDMGLTVGLTNAKEALHCTEEEVRQIESDLAWFYSRAEERANNAEER